MSLVRSRSQTGGSTVVTTWPGEPPKECFVTHCRRPIRSVFINGQLQNGGWGAMCPGCHRTRGIGTGHGVGTVYEKRRADGRFVAV